jgi:hypothetical protein
MGCKDEHRIPQNFKIATQDITAKPKSSVEIIVMMTRGKRIVRVAGLLHQVGM